MMLAGKVIFLLLAVSYAMPVLIGGIRGNTVHSAQVFMLSVGVVGFVTLQWLL